MLPSDFPVCPGHRRGTKVSRAPSELLDYARCVSHPPESSRLQKPQQTPKRASKGAHLPKPVNKKNTSPGPASPTASAQIPWLPRGSSRESSVVAARRVPVGFSESGVEKCAGVVVGFGRCFHVLVQEFGIESSAFMLYPHLRPQTFLIRKAFVNPIDGSSQSARFRNSMSGILSLLEKCRMPER